VRGACKESSPAKAIAAATVLCRLACCQIQTHAHVSGQMGHHSDQQNKHRTAGHKGGAHSAEAPVPVLTACTLLTDHFLNGEWTYALCSVMVLAMTGSRYEPSWDWDA
jgi:hypothetical protein